MFGYVRAHNAELKVKEYEAYRGVYCGLCRSMGKCTGQCSRMTLSFDFAFLALLRICLSGERVEFESRRCIAHPLKKRSMMKRTATLEYCARAAAILNYHKIKDDLSDERGIKKLFAVAALPLVAGARRRALRAGLGELDRGVYTRLCELSELEKKRVASVDAPATVFGEILALICSYGLEGADARIAAQLGKSVGKWIYSVDALDDIPSDAKRGRYNPFLLLYGGRAPSGEQLSGVADALRAALADEAETALDLVECDNRIIKNIVDNIMFLGLPDVMDGVIRKLANNKSEGNTVK